MPHHGQDVDKYAPDIIVCRAPDWHGNYICDGVQDNLDVDLALAEIDGERNGICHMRAALYNFAAEVIPPLDCHVVGASPGHSFYSTRVRVVDDITAFNIQNARSSVRNLCVDSATDAGYGATTPLILVQGQFCAVENIYFWRSDTFANFRGIALQLWAEAAAGRSPSYGHFRHLHANGKFNIGYHLFNQGAVDFINGNTFIDTWASFKGTGTAYKLESTGGGETMRNIFYSPVTQNPALGFELGVDCIRNEFHSPVCWDMLAGSTNISCLNSVGTIFRDGFINSLRTTTLDPTTEMINVAGYYGEMGPSEGFPFVEGTEHIVPVNRPQGYLIDGGTDYAWAAFNSPPYMDHTRILRIWGISNVDELHGMMLNISMYGGASNDPFNLAAATATKASETTNFVTDDYIYWQLDATDDAEFDNYDFENGFQLKVWYQALSGDDCATDAVIQSARLFYNRRE